MAGIWTLKINRNFVETNEVQSLSTLFDKPIVVCSITSPLQQDSWFRSGYLAQMKPIPALGFDCEVERDYRLGFRPKLIKFPLAMGEQYKLRFSPMPWMITYRIVVYEYSEEF
jgi:hypothetical protein